MSTINQVIAELLGSFTAAFYITYFLFVLLGVIISLRLHAFNRDKSSKKTPYKFSLKFLFQDNLIRIVSSMAVVFVAIRLGTELFSVTPNYAGAVAMGLGFDQILIQLQKIEFKARQE
jgi:ABC-type phosphate/phosphonate transport system permease subunit